VGDLGSRGSVITVGVLSIEATQRVDGLVQLLRQGVRRLPPRAKVAIHEENGPTATRVALEWPDEADDAHLRVEVAHALAEHIVANVEPELLNRLIRRHYSYFDEEERQEILLYARPQEPQTGGMTRRLTEYLEGHRALNVDGFITFRLKDYIEALEHSVDEAVDDFLLEREYREFVRLLRYFVDVQAPKTEAVHVLMHESGQFELRDANLQPLEGELDADFHFESQDTEINLDDLLVSSLITLAPKEVVVHGIPRALELQSVRTVRQVFGDRLRTCGGCGACAALLRAEL